jgi:hypothetical protein
MSTFWNTLTYNLAFEDLVQFRVTTYNANGWGLTSETNTEGALVRTVPRFMNPVVRDPVTNDQQMFIYWTGVSSNEDIGGSPILSYGLQWDNGSNEQVWTSLQGYMSNSLLTEFIE